MYLAAQKIAPSLPPFMIKKVRYTMRWLIYAVYLLFPVITNAQTIYEAEGPQTQLTNASIGNMPSASGGAYVEYLITQGNPTSNPPVSGSSITFTVSVPTTGMYTVASRYAAGREYLWTMSVYVNGRDMTQARFPSTGSWSNWSTQSVVIPLQAGNNTVAYKYDNDDSGWINLDYIQVTPAATSGYTTGSAAAVGWFPSEVSADQFTGTAQVRLPLFTITAPGLSVPVALLHSASGVQVDDQGGSVGVNWSLQAGVSISRLVRGLPDDFLRETNDDKRYGWLRYPTGSSPATRISTVPDAPMAISATGCTTTEQVAYSSLYQFGNLKRVNDAPRVTFDTEPDIFYYSLPGHVGSFVFDAQGQVRTIPFDPITITVGPTPLGATGINSFTIKTPDGVTYTFDQIEAVLQKTKIISATPKYFLRDYYSFLVPDGAASLRYNTAWHASQITTLAGGRIQFEYLPITNTTPQNTARKLLAGNPTTPPAAEYKTELKQFSKLWLQTIKSPTATVTFRATQRGEQQYSLESITITSPLNNDALIKRYSLNYITPASDYTGGKSWVDEDGALLDASGYRGRLFLSNIQASNGCSSQPLYSFTYHQTTAELSSLCPIGSVTKDYWGFYNDNKAKTLIPKLFVNPQLVNGANSVPSAPYRLYAAAFDYNSGSFALNGADRRPAADFNTSLAGTLTEVTFATGGKVSFEYEPHQFYDAIAKQSIPAAGVRIRTIKAQDPVTKIEVRRDYYYQGDDGRTSGVLLHAPQFAFAVPATGTTTQEQWTNASVRAGEDLAFDPFETRTVGYRQVTEKLVGKGEIVTRFQAPGTADEVSVAAATTGVGWSRPLLGIGRQTSACSSAAPLQAGSGLYPLSATPNYDFLRGVPLQIVYRAEPIGTATGQVVRQRDFVYQYRNLRPTLPAVKGLAYEALGSDAYAYGKYDLLTDFQYTARQETVTTNNQNTTPTVSNTLYRYNDKGWLAAVAVQNSDQSYRRTRYRYLNEYSLSNTSTDPQAQAMYTRVAAPEGISSDVVETIAEIVTPAGQVRFIGSTLNTYTFKSGALGGASALTRPYQTLRWQPAQSIAGYDSVRVVNNALYVNPGFRPVATILETDGFLMPVSTRIEAGRKISGQHLGYGGTLPVLQIDNAVASDVLFTDFESTKAYSFAAYDAAGNALTSSSVAARTGKQGMELTANSYLQGVIPGSTENSYRLTLWVKASQATTIQVTVPGSSIPAQSVPVTGNGQWVQAVIAIDFSSIPQAARNGSVIRLGASGTVQIDDVTLAPVSAVTTSATYDLSTGKTSQTDPRGRTTYYEYNSAGELAFVRDHNKSITQQFEKVIAGRRTTFYPGFSTTGLPQDGEEVTLQAFTGCEPNLEFAWDFGDGSTQAYSASPTVTHRFYTQDKDKVYQVKLLVRSQGRVYSNSQSVSILRKPLVLNSCTQGVVAVDDCGLNQNSVEQGCDTSTPASTTSVTYLVRPANSGTFTYTWESADPRAQYPAWTVVQTGSNSSYTVGGNLRKSSYVLRCRVSDGSREAVSDVFSISHYQSMGPQANCLP